MGKTKKKRKKQNTPYNARSDAGERARSNIMYIGDYNTFHNVQQGNFQNSNLTQTIPDTKKIREKLKDAYKNLRLPMVSWMQRGSGKFLVGHHFIQLQLHEGNSVSTATSGVEIELQNIFDDFEGDRPSRILIESQPGFGKTTLAHKIIDDWAADKDYVSHFDLAILITLRSLKTKTTTKSIEDVVREKTEVISDDDRDTWKTINNDKTLLVLDGLDEVDDRCKENVFKILYDTFNIKMVVVVTCRTGLFELDDEYVNVVHGGAKKGDKFWDTKISISGITEENRTKFLKTYIDEENEQQTLKRIKNILNQFNGSSVWADDDNEMWTDKKADEDDEINEKYDGNLNGMFKSPLFLILLVFVVERTSQDTIKTKTDLFKNLVDCLIRRYASKNQKSLKPNFTIFVEHLNDSLSKGYHELFEKFGNLAIDRILNGDLHFECDSNTDQIYEIGFFIKHEQQEKKELLQHYECFHLSILEFAAAFAIWRNFLCNGKTLLTSDRDKIILVCKQKGATSLVIPFLFGLMSKYGKELLSQLSDYNVLYNTKNKLMELVFIECNIDDSWRDVVTNFVPSEIHFSNNSLLVQNPMLNQRLDKLYLSSSDLRFLSHSLSVKFLKIEMGTWKNLNPNIIDCIKCEHLLLKFSSSLQDYDVSNLVNLQKIVSISAHTREVHITTTVPKDILQYVNSQVFDNVVVDMLVVETLNSEFTQQLIASIIERVTANYLSIMFTYSVDTHLFDDCSSIIYKSSNVKSILFFSDVPGIRINFELIADGGGKKWTSFMLNDIFVDIRPLVQRYSVDIENLFITDGYPDVLELVAPRRLGCNYEFLRSVASDSHWRGWESVVELTLIFHSRPMSNLLYLRRFNRLKSVTLYISNIDTLLRCSLVDLGRELSNCTGKIRIFIDIFNEQCVVTLLDYIKDATKHEKFNSSQRIVLLIHFNVTYRNAQLNHAESVNFIMATAPNIRFKFFFIKNVAVDWFLAQNIIDYSACSVDYKICPLCNRWKYVSHYFFLRGYYRVNDFTMRVLSLRKSESILSSKL